MSNEEILKNIKEKDYIAFQFDFGNFGKEVEVAEVTTAYEDKVIVHWYRGWQSESQIVKKSEIIAIGKQFGTSRIKGWIGKFHILIPDHPLLEFEELKPVEDLFDEFPLLLKFEINE